VLKGDGKVFTAGYNDNGQCGLGHQMRVSTLQHVASLPPNVKAKQVHAYNGCEHTMVVTEDGKLYSFGYNYRGQLGHGTTVSELVPRPVRGLDNKRVKNLSCSYYHTVVLCESDEVYSFGRNDFGQLGHNDMTDKKFPQAIESLKGKNITTIGCGQYHTVVGNGEGRVFACGKNDYGQLGIESGENQKRMVTIRGALENENVIDIRCGYYHTLALTSRGRVYGFGRNDYGQLGLGQINVQRVHGPHIIGELENKGVVKISAGCYHSVFGSDTGMLYVCGRNNHGQLGTGDTSERHLPHPIDTFQGENINMIAAGFYNTIILTGGDSDDDCCAGMPPNNHTLATTNSSNNIDDDGDDEYSDSINTASLDVHSGSAILSLPYMSLENRKDSPIGMQTDAAQTIDSHHTHNAVSFPEEGSYAGSSVDDVASEVTLQSSYDQAEIENMRSKGPAVGLMPEHGGYLCEFDGAVKQDKGALFILAHMERLCEPHIPSLSDFPTLGVLEYSLTDRSLQTIEEFDEVMCESGIDKAVESGEVEKGSCNTRKQRYCIDVSPQTFSLLLQILTSLVQKRGQQFTSTLLLAEHRSFILLATLKLLKGNIAKLLTIKILAGNVRAMMGEIIDNPAAFGVDPDGDDDDDDDDDDNDNDDGSLSLPLIQSLTYSLLKLHKVLLQLISSPPSLGCIRAASAVQEEAASAIVLGVELFYPRQREQINIVERLLRWKGAEGSI